MAPRTRHRCLLVLKACAFLLLAFAASPALALDAAAIQSMVIVEGDTGRGSAFVVKMDGKPFLVTNSHVIRGNQNLKFKNLRNAELTTGALEIADAVDAVRAELPAAPNALELEPQVDQVRIGDEIVVAGNSEGEGVVREIPGKVVGIGPDRVEVDAEFVPGNSGSPILLKSTGKVIGVATYVKLPRSLGAGRKSPLSLNEVRRFGYRLDTVARWIKPPAKDRLEMEGVKLTEIEDLRSAITAVFGANAALVTRLGVSGFVPKDKARQFPAFAALASGIDEFVKNQTAAKTDDDKAKNAAAFFARLKGIVSDDVHGLNESQFSGFYSVQLKEALAGCQEFYDWFDGTTMPAFRDAWLASRMDSMFVTGRKPAAPPIDPDKLKLVLTDQIAPNEAPENRHHVGYPPETQPANLANLFWIIETPKGERRAIGMHKTFLRVRTPINGAYRVYVEFRGSDKTRVVSTIAEFKVEGLAVADAGAAAPATPAPDKTKPQSPEVAISEDATIDSRDFSLSGSGFALAKLSNGDVAFSNRGYVWQDVPANLNGRRYTRAPGGNPPRVTVHAKRDTTLEVITAIDQPGVELSGWKETGPPFTYSDDKHTRVVLLQKHLTAGQDLEIPRGNWSGVLVLLPD